jgi:hypothetical protein
MPLHCLVNASTLSEVVRQLKLGQSNGFNSGALSIEPWRKPLSRCVGNSLCVFNGVSWPEKERDDSVGRFGLWLCGGQGQGRLGNGESSEKRMVSLSLGEPSPSLFDDPAGFEEVPPSQLFPHCKLDTLDEYYYSHRPQSPD